MFAKILVPLDGSEIAKKVLPKVIELAKTFNAKVTFFHACYSAVATWMGEAAPGTIKAGEDQEQKFCQTFLSQAAQDVKDQGVDADWTCNDGVPAREIIAYAQDNGYELIVMGTHGSGEVAWYMGDVASKVAAHATVPVLLFRTMPVKPPPMKEEYFR
jgi:nucleotide-binding universal stress UspA family protein